jgi:hypothetical protein
MPPRSGIPQHDLAGPVGTLACSTLVLVSRVRLMFDMEICTHRNLWPSRATYGGIWPQIRGFLRVLWTVRDGLVQVFHGKGNSHIFAVRGGRPPLSVSRLGRRHGLFSTECLEQRKARFQEGLGIGDQEAIPGEPRTDR